MHSSVFFFFQAEDGIRDLTVTGVQTCALPIYRLNVHRQAAARGVVDAGELERRRRGGPPALDEGELGGRAPPVERGQGAMGRELALRPPHQGAPRGAPPQSPPAGRPATPPPPP